MNKDAVKPNPEQQKVIDTVDGPVLVVAGAGTGKTATIVKRIEHIIADGYALPWQVLAITFTNKAAGELKERLMNTIGAEANEIWAATFHSMCARMLRRFADRLGYTQHFTIYDTDDQKRVMKRVQKSLGIEDKYLNHRSILAEISNAKDSLIGPQEYRATNVNDFRKAKIGQCYEEYQKELLRSDAMDFDDMIFNTVQLLQDNEDVLNLYQNQFKYIIVDEYQDTSYAQYVLTYLLAGGHHNICVVGDDDQSIYRFRGATIENIMRFKERYEDEGLKVIQLQLAENYRSMQNILDAANSVISNNKTRLADKRLRSYSVSAGEKVTLYTGNNEMDEAQFIIDEINRVNLSKIFGELFMLIEKDKRGIELQLLYSDENFSVPPNVYIIGMMNTADRSLAMLDYALRRRFSFFTMKPGFNTIGFQTYQDSLKSDAFKKLISCIKQLNSKIAADISLGEGFCIGHSYFCGLTAKTATVQTLTSIIEYELIPLLKEYWFDEPEKIIDWSDRLRSTVK